jgi:peptidoglycan/xylan/chitin deacetylase (PgdA/CDA1 family)
MYQDKNDTLCLMFHDVKIHPKRWNLTPDTFENIIRQILPFRENVIITVDDGGIGNFKYILPLLEKYGLKGIFFIPTAYISKSDATRPNYMNRSQIRDIHLSGHIIGSHSHSHPRNISLMPPEKVNEEWTTSKLILEEITGETVTTCSIPGGFYNPKHLAILKTAGYDKIFNSTPKYGLINSSGVQIVGRFSIENDTKPSDIDRLLSRNRSVQSYLFCRHFVSKSVHTLLHRLQS